MSAENLTLSAKHKVLHVLHMKGKYKQSSNLTWLFTVVKNGYK